ncbi:MAG: YeeE/YedE family protein [Deltaproteobacteria bacterium]|nr:YeeE/YedE family protein [Deltaproteobacteria bacterium]
MNVLLAAFLSGAIFACGLAVGGMTQPAKVTAFLDIAGNWDPSLAFVMMGAIMVHAVLYRAIRRRPSPLFAAAFALPVRTDLDARLIGGAALFGVGWGLGGFCPGPAVTSLASGREPVLIFVIAMLAGMYLYRIVERLSVPRSPVPQNAPASA